MTATDPDPSAPLTEVPGSPVVRAEPDSRLEQLVALYDQQDATAKEAEEKLKSTKDAIKAELAELHPTATEVLLVANVLERPLRFYAQTSWRFDSTTLKKRDPATWVRYAYEKTSWYLARVK